MERRARVEALIDDDGSSTSEDEEEGENIAKEVDGSNGSKLEQKIDGSAENKLSDQSSNQQLPSPQLATPPSDPVAVQQQLSTLPKELRLQYQQLLQL